VTPEEREQLGDWIEWRLKGQLDQIRRDAREAAARAGVLSALASAGFTAWMLGHVTMSGVLAVGALVVLSWLAMILGMLPLVAVVALHDKLYESVRRWRQRR
jgi:hypothetical protein